MSKWNWDTDRSEASNVSVNDGVVTYYAEWDIADDEVTIDLQEVAEDFSDGYDFGDDPSPVSITVMNLITGEELEDEFSFSLKKHHLLWNDAGEQAHLADDEDADDDEDEDEDDEEE